MSQLAKLDLRSYARSQHADPAETRRQKLLQAIEEQLSVVDAAINGERYIVSVPKWATDTDGTRTAITRQRVVRAWFFQHGNGFYVQCKYANKVLALSKDANSVFVKALPDVKTALQTLYSAAASGELDAELAWVATTRSKRV